MSGSSAPAQRLAVLLEAQRAVWIEVPKVACSSIKVVLADLLGIDLASVGGNPHKGSFPEPTSRPTESVLYPGLFSFAFVRNPWSRLVSCYRDKILGEVPDFTSFHPTRGVAHCLARFPAFRAGMSFDDFITAVAAIPDAEADEHFRAQYTFVTSASGAIGIDFVGRFETLAGDFRHVFDRLHLSCPTLPHVQAAPSPGRYPEYYTPRTRNIVADRFREDVSLFGYEFGKSEA